MIPLYDQGGVQVYHGNCCDVFDRVDLFPTSTIITAPPHNYPVYDDEVLKGTRPWQPEDEIGWYVECVALHLAWMHRAQALLNRSAGRCWIVTGCLWLPAICRVGSLLHWPMPEVWYAMPLEQALLLFGLGIPDAERRLIDAAFRACVTTPKVPMRLLDAILDVSSDGPVLDPFCGHGGVLIAAKRKGLQAVGVDTKLDRCEATIAALEAA